MNVILWKILPVIYIYIKRVPSSGKSLSTSAPPFEGRKAMGPMLCIPCDSICPQCYVRR